VLRRIRFAPNTPFGGVQMILCGDFLQLPPVQEGQDRDAPARFAYDAKAWTALNPLIVELHGSFRQHDDPAFLQLLNEVRVGYCSAESQTLLRQRMCTHAEIVRLSEAGGVLAHLYPHNMNVDAENAAQLKKLAMRVGRPHTFVAIDTIDAVQPEKREALQKQLDKLRAPAVLELCVGAQVMLLQNIDVQSKLANGTQGRVIAFQEGKDRVPIVDFVLPDGQHLVSIVPPRSFKIEARGRVLAERMQVPLMLSWAITVHKSQGFTITGDTVMDLGTRIFANGQAYVALSRLTRLANLKLIAFDPKAIRADARVLEWLRQHGSVALDLDWTV
jgi:ATP-dependent DNA helicase PIF1